MRQPITSIPDEILEAARIDGASEWYIFHRIISPMSRNAISSLAKQLLSVGLKLFNSQYSTDYGGLFAATAVSIIPVVIVYVIFQKRFIEGIAGSAVKG